MAAKSEVKGAIAQHRTLVEIDEAPFDDAGQPIATEDRIRASEADMAAAWMALMAAPCLTLADVRAKVDYVMNGTIGERDRILRDLTGPEGSETFAHGNCLPTFLRSIRGQGGDIR